MKLICNYYIRNYGSVLQSFASFKVLQSFDPSISIIKYEDKAKVKAKIELLIRKKLKYILNPVALKKKIINLAYQENYKKIDDARKRAFDVFNNKNLNFTQTFIKTSDIVSSLEHGESIIIGSDQLWGPEDIIRNYHTLNWLPDEFKKISYATSFGVTKLPDYLKKRTYSFLKKMDNISVRESTGIDIIKSLTGLDASLVCDPTLLLSANQWNKFIPEEKIISEPYIFCYFIGENIKHREVVKEVQMHTNYKIAGILHVNQYIKSDENFADYDFSTAKPEDFVRLIRDAQYVICDSFHGVAFSIIFKKNFIVFDRYARNDSSSRNSRIDSICKKLKLESRHCIEIKNANSILNDNVNYTEVDDLLEKWRQESFNYISNAINNTII